MGDFGGEKDRHFDASLVACFVHKFNALIDVRVDTSFDVSCCVFNNASCNASQNTIHDDHPWSETKSITQICMPVDWGLLWCMNKRKQRQISEHHIFKYGPVCFNFLLPWFSYFLLIISWFSKNNNAIMGSTCNKMKKKRRIFFDMFILISLLLCVFQSKQWCYKAKKDLLKPLFILWI